MWLLESPGVELEECRHSVERYLWCLAMLDLVNSELVSNVASCERSRRVVYGSAQSGYNKLACSLYATEGTRRECE